MRTTRRVAFPGVALALALGCQPGGASNADSVATAPVSSTPAVINAAPAPAPDSAAKATTSASSATSTGVKKPASQTSPAKSPVTAKTKAPIATDTIIGWDSIIRGPIRTVPRPSSTPTRE